MVALSWFVAIVTSVASVGAKLSPGAAADPAQYVNQLIGTANGGHVFAGATLPFGSVKAVADSNSNDNQGGFVSDGSSIRGISQLHDDGTGGGSSLGNFKILPMLCNVTQGNCQTNEVERSLPPGNVSTSPGYFSIGLGNNFTAEVTVTAHTALHRITYHTLPSDTALATLLVDLTNDLSHSFANGSIQIQTPSTHLNSSGNLGHSQTTRVTGGGNFGPSFGIGTYNVFFCLDAPGVESAAVYNGNTILNGTNFTVNFEPAGALLQLDSKALKATKSELLVRVGVSFLSSERACEYASTEVPDITSASFNKVKAAARARWNDVLGTVQVETKGVTKDRNEIFWSSLYRSYISPINVTGDNPLWESTEPYYDSYYCIWDSFRTVHPLFAITQPGPQAEMVRALIDIYRHLGFLPDCRMSTDQGFTQGGSNADSLLADSFVKGIKGGVDWQTGYEAMVKDATVEPPNWGVEGRGGIESRKQLHYVPQWDTTDPSPVGSTPGRSASRTLEYSYNDFSIALVAQGLGHTADYNTYVNASGDWVNLWDPSVNNTGFSGFIQPRLSDGTFVFVDPRHCSPVLGHLDCFLNPTGGEFYEASSWEYSFYVPHDMAKVIGLMGGQDTFVKRLDAGWDNLYLDIGDEPAFLLAFLYNYGGAPSHTVDRVLTILAQNYSTAVGGLPGNDDSGAMGAFVVWSSFGIYPVAGQAVYLISTPLYPSISITNQITGTTAHIKVLNFDGASTNKYIQHATLNGKPYNKNWLSHDIFVKGGTLVLTVGPKPSTWGTRPEDLPPSISTGYKVD
ncbi:alpha-1,2-mannosidase, putative subfamily [Dentipellis sp. KUC8613]|nr:alpha-1,2-mannosidase, putative subfamily [Dentipellis sp. KUC8613]